MSDDADAAKDQEAHETDRQVNSMQDQLSKEVASWSKGRREQTSEPVISPSTPAIEPGSARSARGSKAASAASIGAKGHGTGSKPFSMSYGGMTPAEYMRYLLERGTR